MLLFYTVVRAEFSVEGNMLDIPLILFSKINIKGIPIKFTKKLMGIKVTTPVTHCTPLSKCPCIEIFIANPVDNKPNIKKIIPKAIFSPADIFLSFFQYFTTKNNIVIGNKIRSKGIIKIFIVLLLSYLTYPTLPSKLICNNFCASTANSIGSLLTTSFTYPFTISPTASSSPNPR